MLDVSQHETVAQSARQFRVLLNAMARPGIELELCGDVEAPTPLSPAAAIAARNLFDFQTPVWLSPEVNSDEVLDFLRFHTGAVFVKNPGEAAFAILNAKEFEKHLQHFSIGTDEYPDRSATVIVQTGARASASVTLRGPGIKDSHSLSVPGITLNVWRKLSDNSALFPLGIDMMFAGARSVIGLPRSTKITLAEKH
jgi:alpha-D-ribose 1-methylphosphonate 5-triphosphate synthase subunit PhnH